MDRVRPTNNMNRRTPTWLIERVRKMAPIGLDPCASLDEKHHFAEINLTECDDGLSVFWHECGLVYVNPPYGAYIRKWIDKIIEETERGCEIILLCPARCGTRWWITARRSANVMIELEGRLKFDDGDDPAMFASALMYFGRRPLAFIEAFKDLGLVVPRWGAKCLSCNSWRGVAALGNEI